MTLGQRIQQIRNSVSLSQEAFGEKLGTTRQTVSKWELDQTVPEIGKIVLMSRLFSVTTDSILVDGISTFDASYEQFVCGVYKSKLREVVETERFALVYYCSQAETVLGTRLYVGIDGYRKLYGICEYNKTDKTIGYAYRAETESQLVYANDDRLKGKLGQIYNDQITKTMKRTESFSVNHDKISLPTVNEAGIKNCLLAWRMADSFSSTAYRFHFWLCTGKTEYNFSIEPQDINIYCGISYNFPFDLGMFGGRQFFRIRNYKDNSQPWCRFYSDLGYECNENDVNIPADKCELGKSVQTDQGIVWGLKRYTDDQIVLQGCGDDEYYFGREDKRTETFYFCGK
ncbi:MAG: helix-turn-helix transcriptional regulator [Lachnospiraceae bacterium]|nr:helix-turn-helix transcriptional regulator [Lachnospiraceae bacterium]